MDTDTGLFKPVRPIERKIGSAACWNNNEVKDAEMIAELIDRVLTKGLIDTASASGQQVNFAVQVCERGP